MKIKTLIKQLSKLNQNLEVILSSDAEGNSYGLLSEIYNKTGLKYSTDYDNGSATLFDRDNINDDITPQEYKKMKDCIILYPK